MMALIRFMIQSWFTATWWAITPTGRLSSSLLIRTSGVFFPFMRQCSTVRDSARRAERVVLVSGMAPTYQCHGHVHLNQTREGPNLPHAFAPTRRISVDLIRLNRKHES